MRVADAAIAGCTHARHKKILSAGAVLWAWDADPEYDGEAGEERLFLRLEKWNSHVQYAWRYDPCELAPQGAARLPPREPQLDPEDPWVTDDENDPQDDFECFG